MTFIIGTRKDIPKVGGRASLGTFSVDTEHDCKASADTTSWKPDEEDPLAAASWLNSWFLDCSRSLRTGSWESKYGDSITVLVCRLKLLRRTSHWISFS